MKKKVQKSLYGSCGKLLLLHFFFENPVPAKTENYVATLDVMNSRDVRVDQDFVYYMYL